MSELMAGGVQLMLVGMGTVFFFLTTLVLATMLMSAVLGRFFPAPATADAVPSQTPTHDDEVAAISAALHLHQHRHHNSR